MARPRIGTRSSSADVNRQPWETPCATCGKLFYVSRKAAKQVAKALYPGHHMQVYACFDNDTLFHIGHIVPAVLAGKMSRQDLQPPNLARRVRVPVPPAE